MGGALLLLCGLLCSELAAAILAWSWEGRWPWWPAPTPTTVASRDRGDPVAQLRLNPYYGYTLQPRMKVSETVTDLARRNQVIRQFGPGWLDSDLAKGSVNNHGFLARHDYPYADPTGRTFLIGVFGGSVAHQFALTMGPVLDDLLSRHPHVRGRRVEVLDFANGGIKQPQQATTLAYFLSIGQRFDFVVNLDGFNEAFIAWHNVHELGIDERMPFARMVFGIQNVVLESYGALAGDDRIARRRGKLNDLDAKLQGPQSALWFAWRSVERRRVGAALTELERHLARSDVARSYAMPLLRRSPLTDTALIESVLSTWFDSSVAIAGLAKAFGIPYLHVLQPNQYVTKAVFTDEQRKSILNSDAPLTTLIPEAYERYRKRAAQFPANGVHFFDASPVFDGFSAEIFVDNCCHFNEAANRVLARAMATRMAAVLNGGRSITGVTP